MLKYLESDIIFRDDKITFLGAPSKELEIMMSWEDPIMKKHVEFLCENGGDILEIGFGMGISANYIQSYNPKSHTIIEIHPQILEKANAWAEDKSNVNILEGDWFDVLPSLGKFDGIFYDTFGPYSGQWKNLAEMISAHTRDDCRVTFWNFCRKSDNQCGFGDAHNITYEQIEIDPPQNTYFNDKVYFLPKVIM